MSAFVDNAAVVLDLGTSSVKGGLAGGEVPACVLPSSIGIGPDGTAMVTEPTLGSAFSSFRWPIHHGAIENVDDAARLVRRAMDELHVIPEDRALLVCGPPLSPNAHFEAVAEMAFEAVGVPALHCAVEGLMALYSVGRTDACVVCSGEGATYGQYIHVQCSLYELMYWQISLQQ